MKQKDLQKLYQDFRHYFCKEMPRDMDIKITRARSYLGAMWRYDDKPGLGIYFGKPLMEDYMKKDPTITWESILLHEMCHVWQYIKIPNDKEAHSPRFMDKLRAVERLTGIPQFWDFED